MNVKGVRVAFLAYTEFTNGFALPHPWSVNLASAPRIIADAHRARVDGAQAVIVNLHWGNEYVSQPSSYQVHLARKLTRSPDITAIVGQHVHVVQPIRFINGKPVVFGEGNLISDQTSACCPAATQDGMIVLLTILVRGRTPRSPGSVMCRSGSGTRTSRCSRPAPPGATTGPTPQRSARPTAARSLSSAAVRASSLSPPTWYGLPRPGDG